MYKGKFDAKAKGHSPRNQTAEPIRREAPRSAAPARPEPRENYGADYEFEEEEFDVLTQQKARQREQRAAERAERSARPARPVVSEEPEKPRKKGPRLGSIIFYTLYFLFICAFFVGVFWALNWVNGWLKAYEAAQPTVKSQEVFAQLFSDPDWGRLYRLAGVEDTVFEGTSEFAAYMEEKIGGRELNFVETSSGLSGNKKYIVRAGTDKIASFTLLSDGQAHTVTDIVDWQMGDVELFYSRDKSVRIKKLENHITYVNGIPLDDSYTIRVGSTRADEYLPQGTPIVRTSVQQIDNLLNEPQIIVYDETASNQMAVVYNPVTDTYEEQTDSIVISEDERAAVFGALEAYSGFMINASGSSAGVAKYFDTNSRTYSDIVAMGKELWMNADRGHEFQNEEILGFTKHSDTLFSVRASLNMHVNCKDGTEKDYPVTESMFFVRRNDAWVCNEMINLDITQPTGQVRLTFCDENGAVISAGFYDITTESLITPTVNVPAGKSFTGWMKIEPGANNTKKYTLVFEPDQTGTVYMNGNSLEPMTLYPLFE